MILQNISRLKEAHQHYDILWLLYLSFIGLFFFVHTELYHIRFFILAVITSAAFSLSYSFLKQLFRTPLFLMCLSYFFYMALSLLWSDPVNYKTTLDVLSQITLLISFIAITCYLFLTYPNFAYHLGLVITISAFIAAIISITSTTSDVSLWQTRFSDIGRGHHPIKTAALYGSVLLWVYYLSTASKQRLFTVVGLCLFIFVVMTQSRGPLLAFFLTIIANLIWTRRVSRILWACGGLLLLYTTLVATGLIDSAYLFSRADSGRIEIYRQSIPLIQEHPMIGHGITPEIGFNLGAFTERWGITMGYPHNIFLSQLLHGGIIGLTILAALFYSIIKSCRKQRGNLGIIPELLTFFVICGLFDFSLLITTVSIEWILFWIAVSWLLSLELRSCQPTQTTTPQD